MSPALWSPDTLANTSATAPVAAAHDGSRRDFIFLATGAGLAVGAGAAIAWPLVSSMAPDAETIAAGAPIDVDLTPIQDGQIVNVFWRGKLIFVRKLTEKEVGDMKAIPISALSDPAAVRQPGQERPRPVAHRLRKLHASRLRADRPPGQFRGLGLPVPRFAVRRGRPRAPRASADQPADPAPTPSRRMPKSGSARAARQWPEDRTEP